MLALLVVAALAQPLRIAIDCQGWGRTKACPSFLLGFVEHNALFLSSPRSDAEVVVYYNVTEVANIDRVHLRFVGEVEGAPPVVETEVELDTRADDDTQRAQLEPAFARGAALFVAARHPESVAITLTPPDGATLAAPSTTPWGFSASLSGYGSWTSGYQSMNVYSGLSVSRIERESAFSFSLNGSFGANRQPPLIVDGMEVSLDTSQYSASATLAGERHLSDHWALGSNASAWHEDPEGQYELGFNANTGIEWDLYQADDPRGNRLAVRYMVGWKVDKYNARNELRQKFTQYAIHAVEAEASVRKDKISYGLSMGIGGEMIHPMIRHTLSASPYIEVQLGDHVDLSLSFSVTQRAIPKTVVDPSNFEQVSRAAYAEPLSAFASLGLRFHWDRTNGQRNDRFGF